ncbi:MAG: 2-dehydropantoate 2-reductase [Variibacter sp.]|nr:2-dehydropantoate 2-reductase [Variibacter sp.]
MSKSKKIAVLGTGANGSCIAADLTRNGHDVTLIDQWPAHVETMRAEGLRVALPDEELHVKVRAHHLCDLCAINETFDIVFLVVKAYDTRWMCELIKPYLAPDGLLIGVQNGMTADDIAAIVGPSRTIGCVVELSSEIFTPGLVQRNTPPAGTWFGLGSLDPSMDGRVPEVEAILRDVGKVSITQNIRAAKWMKLVVNTMSLGPFAMLGMRISEAAELPGMRDLALKIGAEALEVGQRLGYPIEPIFGLSPEDVRGSNQLLEKLLDKLCRDVGPRARDCVLQDHLKGRYSEVDLINGLVVEESARLGKSAPANAAIVEITRRIRAGTLKPDVSNLELARQLIAQ